MKRSFLARIFGGKETIIEKTVVERHHHHHHDCKDESKQHHEATEKAVPRHSGSNLKRSEKLKGVWT